MSPLEHRRSTGSEALRMLFRITAVVAGFAVMQLFLFPYVWRENPWFVVAFVVVEFVVVVCGLMYVRANILVGREFICRMDNTYIECRSPVESCGQSFRVAVADIVRIERKGDSESRRWYIHDKAGRRYDLTTNYGNPADEFIRRIREVNSSVVEVHT